MNNKILSFFTKEQVKEPIKDKEKIKKLYAFFQPTIFIVMYLMYFVSYLCRRSLSVGFHGSTGIQHSLGLSLNVYVTLGILFNIVYCIGKFMGGFVADRANIRICLPLAIFTAAVSSGGIAVAGILYQSLILKSLDDVSMFMYVCWSISAFISGLTFPMCAKALVFWYSNKSRPYIWAWWSTSHELGTCCSMLLSAMLLKELNWQSVFIVPTLLGIIISIIGWALLRDNPSSVGLPDIETYVGNSKSEQQQVDEKEIQMNEKEQQIDEKKEEVSEESESYWQVFKKDVLFNKVIWILSLTYICVYILRFGPLDWMTKMFMETGKNTDPILAIVPLIVMTVIGTVGTLSISFVSDKVFGGRRAPAIASYLILTTICMIILRLIFSADDTPAIIQLPEHIKNVVMYILMGLIGIGVCGPQVMVGGIAAIESGSKKVSATIAGITGSMGYVGSSIMFVLGGFSKKYGYQFVNNVWIATGILGIILMLFLWNVRANKEFSH